MKQLTQLARPFPSRLVHQNPSGGGQYVAHDVVVQRLLQVVGPFSFTLTQVIRGDVPEIKANPDGKSDRAREGRPGLVGCVVGVVARLTVTIDGREVNVEDSGDCESPHNWPHDGARMKDAMSDAIKRCAMRLGCGLHLWAQDDFYLYEALTRDDPPGQPAEGSTSPARQGRGSVGNAEGDGAERPAVPSPEVDAA